MSVHQTPDGRWFVRFRKGKWTDKPNATRRYFGRDGEDEAHRFNESLGLGQRRQPTGTPFVDLAGEFLLGKVGKIESTSLVTIRYVLQGSLVPFFGDYDAEAITPQVVDKYVAMRLTEPNKRNGRPGVKRATVRRELGILQSILNWAVKYKYIAHNPALSHEKPKDDCEVIAPPTTAEIHRILSVAAPHLVRFILTAYYTAARPGTVEILSLKWSSVDIPGGTILITSARKGGAKSRLVPIHPGFKPLLRRWLHEDRSRARMPEYVVHYNGERVGNLQGSWRFAKKRAGITRRLRMYDLRHAAITGMLEAGSDLKAVSMIAGHSTPAMTMTRYQHASTGLLRQAVDSVITLPVTERFEQRKRTSKKKKLGRVK